VDLDPEVLDWGRRNNLADLRDEQRTRVTLLRGRCARAGRRPRPMRRCLDLRIPRASPPA